MRHLAITAAFPIILAACAGAPEVETEPATDTAAPSASSGTLSVTDETAATPEPAKQLPDNSSLPSILVTPAQNGKGISELQVVQNNPMARAMMEAVNEYLTKKLYDVKSLEGDANLNSVVQMQNDIAETDEDLSYLASLALGADVYIKFSGNVKPGAISVDLNAYESSTARLLGSESAMDDDCGGNDQTAIAECLHKAARRAMPLLEKKIKAYWQNDLEQGVQYKVIMNIKGEFDEEEIEDLHDDIASGLKKAFKRVNVNVMTAKTIDAIIYADGNEFPDSQSVYNAIRGMLKGKGQTKKINLTRKLILMDIE